MRRIAVVLGLCTLLLPTAARANEIPAWTDEVVNEFGAVTIANTGIVSKGSELMSFNHITAPKGHSLGTVSFSTGALISGSLWSGGTFSGTGSTFDVVGVGLWAKRLTGQSRNPVALFMGSFVGPIKWKMVSQTGKYDYVFKLSGFVEGQLWNGREVGATTTQTIYVNQNQWLHDQRGSIHLGITSYGLNTPEPGTLGLFGTGLILAGAMRRKFVGAKRRLTTKL